MDTSINVPKSSNANNSICNNKPKLKENIPLYYM